MLPVTEYRLQSICHLSRLAREDGCNNKTSRYLPSVEELDSGKIFTVLERCVWILLHPKYLRGQSTSSNQQRIAIGRPAPEEVTQHLRVAKWEFTNVDFMAKYKF